MCSTCGCSAAEEIDPVESVVVPAPLGRGVTQYYSEGESATYAPSEEADVSSPATEPTNAHHSAEFCASCGSMNKKADYEEDDEILEGIQYEDEMMAESKAVFTKGKGGKMYARTRDGRIITHNAEFMPEGDGNVVGQQTFTYNGTPLHAEEDTSFGMVGEGNDFGQMRAEDFEADFTLEKPFQTGAKLSAGLLFGAALFGIAGAGFTALLGSMMDRGE